MTQSPLADRLAVVQADALTPQTGDVNARRGDVEGIQESITELGWAGTIVANRSDGKILHGNHRYLAGVAAGMTEFPVYWVECDDPVEQRRLGIALNRWADLAGWDDRVLVDGLVELRDADLLPGIGYDESDIDALLASLEEHDPEDPEPRVPPSDIKISVGTLSFTVTREEYDTFEQRLVDEVGTNREAQINTVRGSLGL